jgi:hypothetical protein
MAPGSERAQLSEKTFNLFLFIEGEFVVELGARCHEQVGSDQKKISFLQSRAEAYVASAQRFPVPARYQLVLPNGTRATGLRYEGYLRLGEWDGILRSSRRPSLILPPRGTR